MIIWALRLLGINLTFLTIEAFALSSFWWDWNGFCVRRLFICILNILQLRKYQFFARHFLDLLKQTIPNIISEIIHEYNFFSKLFSLANTLRFWNFLLEVFLTAIRSIAQISTLYICFVIPTSYMIRKFILKDEEAK